MTKIPEYHRFTYNPDPYQYSRTYDQFLNDLKTKQYDTISMDDGWISQIKACKMVHEINPKTLIILSIITDCVGKEGYMSWNDLHSLLYPLSGRCVISNHTHTHPHLINGMNEEQIRWQIRTASDIIERELGSRPDYFTPPYDQCTTVIECIAVEERLEIIKNRTVILNTSE